MKTTQKRLLYLLSLSPLLFACQKQAEEPATPTPAASTDETVINPSESANGETQTPTKTKSEVATPEVVAFEYLQAIGQGDYAKMSTLMGTQVPLAFDETSFERWVLVNELSVYQVDDLTLKDSEVKQSGDEAKVQLILSSGNQTLTFKTTAQLNESNHWILRPDGFTYDYTFIAPNSVVTNYGVDYTPYQVETLSGEAQARFLVDAMPNLTPQFKVMTFLGEKEAKVDESGTTPILYAPITESEAKTFLDAGNVLMNSMAKAVYDADETTLASYFLTEAEAQTAKVLHEGTSTKAPMQYTLIPSESKDVKGSIYLDRSDTLTMSVEATLIKTEGFGVGDNKKTGILSVVQQPKGFKLTKVDETFYKYF